ncbi:MAG: NAD+ synthase [Gammaproteobacteria bacterium]|nr:MAG: NAD+ synthase [Gammaproteobacteria bacterium]|tara:strand:- start:109 stop:1740 length:1632 start_codon:yes stop_codon:yes gene_type:complete
MKNKISIVLAQLDLAVGDISGNTKLIIDSCEKAKNQHNADLIIFPELSISGYPPEDLLLHSGFKRRINDALNSIKDEVAGISALIGFPDYSDDSIYNACAVFRDKEEIVKYRKEALPNYSVFDEKRYFTSDEQPTVFELKGKKIGINICEDIWHKSAAMKAKESGAEIIIVINGSPYEKDGQSKRENIVKQRALQTDLPIVYLNMIGGQDELVFDGASFVMSKNGEIKYRATSFEESMDLFEFDLINNECVPIKSNISSKLSVAESVYKALVRGTKDYIEKHKFSGVVMGLSGGIDSALTLSIACDAIGSDKVRAVMMPYFFTSAMSLEDAQCQADTLNIKYDILPISSLYDSTVDLLQPIFLNSEKDSTEENIQSRARGLLLMAISNKTGSMLLTTGNKSEMAVGYATLYGDMAGGFAPIKDCTKTMVKKLAKYRNTISEVIPNRVIEREPSAELRENQHDSDSLPPYDVLDPILEAFIEEDLSVEEIVERGFERETVTSILEMVKRNEYKRRQAPPGVRISNRAFGRDWRYPITSGYTFPE